MFNRFCLLAAALLLSTPVFAANSNGTLPDPALTPGSVRTTNLDEICNTPTSAVRDVSGSTKERVRRLYGMKNKRDLWCNTMEGCEIDHLIPLAVGGSNNVDNLWPQPYEGEWNAYHKDHLEKRMRSLMCKRIVSVEDAQMAFRNWIEGYKRYISPVPKPYYGERVK